MTGVFSQSAMDGFAASLLLLLVVNGAPILARGVLGARLALPLDGNRLAPDGRPWLGRSKTVRGMLAGTGAGLVFAPLLGYGALLGAAFGLLAMVGDVLSSLVKRRLGIAPSGMALGLDQIPEALLPLAVLRAAFGLSWTAIALEVLAFLVLELVLSQILYRLNLRNRPY